MNAHRAKLSIDEQIARRRVDLIEFGWEIRRRMQANNASPASACAGRLERNKADGSTGRRTSTCQRSLQ